MLKFIHLKAGEKMIHESLKKDFSEIADIGFLFWHRLQNFCLGQIALFQSGTFHSAWAKRTVIPLVRCACLQRIQKGTRVLFFRFQRCYNKHGGTKSTKRGLPGPNGRALRGAENGCSLPTGYNQNPCRWRPVCASSSRAFRPTPPC